MTIDEIRLVPFDSESQMITVTRGSIMGRYANYKDEDGNECPCFENIFIDGKEVEPKQIDLQAAEDTLLEQEARVHEYFQNGGVVGVDPHGISSLNSLMQRQSEGATKSLTEQQVVQYERDRQEEQQRENRILRFRDQFNSLRSK